MNPLDEALNSKEKLAQERRDQDIHLWQTWKNDPNQDNMHALMKRFEPVFRAKVNQFKAPNVNPSAFRANLKLQAINAFETYDPERAALRTHLDANLKRSMRFNAQHQNMAYIPEGQTAFIGPIDKATDELTDELGRAPSHFEVAQFINERPDLLKNKKRLTATTVARISTNRRKDIISSTMEGDAAPIEASRNQAVLGLLRPELNEDQQQVFDHIYGMNGAPRINSTSALAKKLDKSPSQISRLKSAIAIEYKKYI